MALMVLAQAATSPPPVTTEIIVTAPTSPDIDPMRNAVQACDREAMARLAKAEPHRRAMFAADVYAEQRAVAAARAKLAPIATTPAGKASLDAARAELDARQRRLDDAKLSEQAWRTAVEEMRGDFLANCPGKRD